MTIRPLFPLTFQPRCKLFFSLKQFSCSYTKRVYMTKAKVFSTVNLSKTRDYWDYDNFEIKWNTQEKYEIIRKIGRGKYSDVFHGVDVTENIDVVIKVLKPVRKKKISREIKILENLKDGDNIIKLIDCVYDSSSCTPSIIFEYVDNISYKQLYLDFTLHDIQYYLYQLLKALHYSHSMGIMHRDVKPHNITIDNSKRKLRLIDWGLAEFYHPYQNYNVRVASRHYKGPELLFDFQSYDYSLDLWGVGCTMACMIFRKDPFFNGGDNYDQIVKIAMVLGSDDLNAYLAQYKLEMPSKLLKVMKHFPKQSWSSFITKDTKKYASDDAFDLLTKLLQYDHQLRLTAEEAMSHPFFSVLSNEEKLPVP